MRPSLRHCEAAVFAFYALIAGLLVWWFSNDDVMEGLALSFVIGCVVLAAWRALFGEGSDE